MVTYPVKSRLNFLDKFEKINYKNNLENLPPVTESHVNLLLIDKTVSKYQLFVDSSNESTYPLVYSPRYDSKLLLDHIIKSFKHIERIAVVCHGQENITKFLNNEPFDSDGNIHFMKEIVNGFNVKTIDFLACDTLKYAQWINYFKQLNQMGLIVGASDDRTGNIKYGGDWLLESTGNDIKPVYWTNLIDNYSQLLEEFYHDDGTIRYKYDTDSAEAFVIDVVDSDTIDVATIPPTITVSGEAGNTQYPVTAIKEFAFYGCTSLTSVTIGSEVKIIEPLAFVACAALTTFIVVNNNNFEVDDGRALYKLNTEDGTYELTQYAIGNNATKYTIKLKNYNVTAINQDAFYSCTNLQSVTIGSGVKIIGLGAFSFCTALRDIIIPDTVTAIGLSAFVGCISLTSVHIGSGVETIDSDAFYFCSSLATFDIEADNPNFKVDDGRALYKLNTKDRTYELTQYAIGNNATEYTIKLKGYTVSAIGQFAFAGCNYLRSVTIESGVETINFDAFVACSSLSKFIVVNNNNNNNFGVDDGRALYKLNADKTCELIQYAIGNTATEYTIKFSDYTVTAIKQYAFADCNYLRSVTIGSVVEIIEPAAFAGCTNLQSVTIGTGVKIIEDGAFQMCTALTSIVIPNKVKFIKNYAFDTCTSLTSVTIGAGVEIIEDDAFNRCTSLEKIVVDNNNTSFQADDDKALYKLNTTATATATARTCELIQYAIGNTATEYTIKLKHYTVTAIKDNAFTGCNNLSTFIVNEPNSNFKVDDSRALYKLDTDNTYMLIKYAPKNTNPVYTIPEKIDEISITTIQSYAFNSCTTLKTVTIGAQVQNSNFNFSNCTALSKFIVDGNPNFKVDDDRALYKLNANNTCELIAYATGNNATEYTIKLKDYTVTSINDSAFVGCNYLRSVTIGSEVRFISDGAFTACSSLSKFIVVNNNNFEVDDDRALYKLNNTNRTCELIQYASGNNATEYTIKLKDYTVTAISQAAFDYCTKLQSVTIGSDVEIINWRAFVGCTNLQSVTIGAGVKIIDRYVFTYCTNLKSIYFKTAEFNPNIAYTFSFYGIPATAIFYLSDTQANVNFIAAAKGKYLGYGLKIGSPPDEIDPDYIQSIIQMLNKITDNQLSETFIKINKDKDNLNIFLKAINN